MDELRLIVVRSNSKRQVEYTASNTPPQIYLGCMGDKKPATHPVTPSQSPGRSSTSTIASDKYVSSHLSAPLLMT